MKSRPVDTPHPLPRPPKRDTRTVPVLRSVPTPAVTAYLRRLFARRYGFLRSDIDEILGDALRDYLTPSKREPTSPDGLFVIIALRRAYDRLRRRKLEVSLLESASFGVTPGHEALDEKLLERAAVRFCLLRPRLDRVRVTVIVRNIFSGESFAGACCAAGILRGSQDRYRKAFKECFGFLKACYRSS